LAIYGAVLLGSRSWLTGAPWRQWGMIAADRCWPVFRRRGFRASWPSQSGRCWPNTRPFWPWYGQTALLGGAWTIGLAQLLFRERKVRPASDMPVNVSSDLSADGMAPFLARFSRCKWRITTSGFIAGKDRTWC
jgi:hypothetical protein